MTAEPDSASNDSQTSQLPTGAVGGGMFDAIMPVVLFIGVNRLAGLPWAIGAATLWSLKVAFMRKRRGLAIGKFLPIITVGIVARGMVGIITDSEAVYFGIGIATKASIGLVLIGSAVIGRNLLAKYAPLLFAFDETIVRNPIYGAAMDRVAWIVGAAELVSAGFDVWLFRNSSVDGYLTVRFLVNWPFTTIVLIVCVTYMSRKLDKIPGFPGVGELLERRMETYESAVKHKLTRARPAD